MKMGIVLCKIPKAGLGNQLFPLLRAQAFANLNQLPILVYNYHQLKFGPWLRGEKSKRKYAGFFNFEKSFLAAQMDQFKASLIDKKRLIIEPEIKKWNKNLKGQCFFFNSVPHYEQHFEGLQENRKMVSDLLWNIVSEKIKRKLDKLSPPCIGVHIRMGDFKKAEAGVKFGTIGHTRSPESYFVDMIQSIRQIYGSAVPVHLFSDGRKSELPQLFPLENIQWVEGNNDLTDLLLLSRAPIIITSAGSTFSSWAGFISDAILIVHPEYEGLKIRSKINNEELYEGRLDEKNEQLVSKIRSIKL